jgi:hypothetical protein
MQDVSSGDHSPVADIRLLPIIDLNPSDRSCILSTLLFISNQADRLNIETPSVTFDQPLWIKAVEVVLSQSLNVVCRMGVFHMIMSFLGNIGTVMSGSGLVECFECCYGPNAVTHMVGGKAVARAIRAHFLAQSALYTLLIRSILANDTNEESCNMGMSQSDITEIRAVYDGFCAGKYDVQYLETCEVLIKLDKALTLHMETLKEQCRTARLWIQYLDYIDTLKTVIRAEWTGDWNLHLVSVFSMLSLFAATGHSQYAKCARLYLQMMLDLPKTHPWLNDKLYSGHHNVRRSDRFWGGLSTDLATEQ